jgi:hypothetical protein
VTFHSSAAQFVGAPARIWYWVVRFHANQISQIVIARTTALLMRIGSGVTTLRTLFVPTCTLWKRSFRAAGSHPFFRTGSPWCSGSSDAQLARKVN